MMEEDKKTGSRSEMVRDMLSVLGLISSLGQSLLYSKTFRQTVF